MRIISGKYKGRHIPVRKKFSARPTTDFAKENLFNILSNHIDFEETSALDLFSGTGSIGYEFASRGCTRVDLVEKDPRSVEFIKGVITRLGMDNVRVIKSDAFRFIEKCNQIYHIIVADPPYEMMRINEIPDLIFSGNLLHQDGWFILEHSAKYSFASHSHYVELRKYGSVHFSFFSATQKK